MMLQNWTLFRRQWIFHPIRFGSSSGSFLEELIDLREFFLLPEGAYDSFDFFSPLIDSKVKGKWDIRRFGKDDHER